MHLHRYVNLRTLQEQEEEQLESKYLKGVAKAIYRRRRKTYPSLPAPLAETHEVPLVFVLLSGKSECVYNHCLTSLVELCSNRTITLRPDLSDKSCRTVL